MAELFTEKEKQNIEDWRETKEPLKFEVSNMQLFKNKILKSKGEKVEKRKCFCALADRKIYKVEFYKYWDEYNNNGATTTIVS